MDVPRPIADNLTPIAKEGWNLDHSYASLPAILHSKTLPTPVSAPSMVVLNRLLAGKLGLDAAALSAGGGASIFSGNVLPPGGYPLAQAYAGHQYGSFTNLGDGRAVLLGEQITPNRERFDIQLKGSGPTRYSRGGDGRAALGPMLREYIISEAMHALGIPTTRSLAVVSTGESVLRQDGPLPGAVLTRVAASHIRVGTFQWAAATGDEFVLKSLTDYTIQRHFPDSVQAERPALSLLQEVNKRQAKLIAQWMHVGFIHGVMNTDNMAISGETIDYGPCAFMNSYDPATVFSSIDRGGRYAYGNQPVIAQWNFARFAETLLPLLDRDENTAIEIATQTVQGFADLYHSYWLDGMRRKLGLFNREPGDEEMIRSLLEWMEESRTDYTNTFAALAMRDGAAGEPEDLRFRQWRDFWKARLSRQANAEEESQRLQLASNPQVIPRNHLVEQALSAAQQGDISVMERLLDVLRSPYACRNASDLYRESDSENDQNYRTFCGT